MDAPEPATPKNIGDKPSTENYKEFTNILDEYYLKIEYSLDNKLTIICYNIKLLNNIRYEAKISREELYELSSAFKPYQKINQIFEVIVKIIEDGKFEIKQNSNNISLIINITDMFSQIIKVKIILLDSNDGKRDEFLCILSNEIIKIRKQKDELDIIKKEQEDFKKEIEELKQMI